MSAVYTIWYREFINFFRDKTRIVSSIIMAFMMMFVFYYAMGNFDTSALGIEKIQYLLPGIIVITIFSTSLSNALSLVEDKSEGFMKEFLVAPVSRTSIAIGKILGGATSAIIQGLIILIISPLFGMTYAVLEILSIFLGMIVVAIAISSFGLWIASSVKSTMGFQMVMQMLMMPMMFLSGAFIPLSYLPVWLRFIVYFNPVTYAVSAFRGIAIDTTGIPDVVLEEMGLVLKIGSFQITPFLAILFLIVFSVIFIIFGVRSFKKVSVTQKVNLKMGHR